MVSLQELLSLESERLERERLEREEKVLAERRRAQAETARLAEMERERLEQLERERARLILEERAEVMKLEALRVAELEHQRELLRLQREAMAERLGGAKELAEPSKKKFPWTTVATAALALGVLGVVALYETRAQKIETKHARELQALREQLRVPPPSVELPRQVSRAPTSTPTSEASPKSAKEVRVEPSKEAPRVGRQGRSLTPPPPPPKEVCEKGDPMCAL